MKFYQRVECPYCRKGFVVTLKVKNSYGNHKVLLCPLEDGGCDRLFAADFEHAFRVTTYSMNQLGTEEVNE